MDLLDFSLEEWSYRCYICSEFFAGVMYTYSVLIAIHQRRHTAQLDGCSSRCVDCSVIYLAEV